VRRTSTKTSAATRGWNSQEEAVSLSLYLAASGAMAFARVLTSGLRLPVGVVLLAPRPAPDLN
jgi:hypothetical protein